MLDINRILKSNRQMKALTGMNIIEFELLVPIKNLKENLYPLSKNRKTMLYLALESLLSMSLVV